MNNYDVLSPSAPLISSWAFELGEEEEVVVAQALHMLAQKNGIGLTEQHYLFVAVMRMYKSDSLWSE